MSTPKKPRQSSRAKQALDTPAEPWAEAIAHLRKADPRWADLIDRVGPCVFELHPDRFGTLVRAIIGQQISAAAARSIDKKLRALCGDPHRPAPLIEAGEETLRTVGLSGVKARYILNLSNAVHSGELPLDVIHEWDDETIIQRLTAIKGIGSWTAEMFLIFSLGRPDVLSPGDLGIRAGLRDFHGLPELPTPKQCRELTESWRPYRTIGMWYLWQKLDVVDKKSKR